MLFFLIVTFIFYVPTQNLILSIVLTNLLCIVIFLTNPFAQNEPEEYENEREVREQTMKRRITKDEWLEELIVVIICSLVVLMALKGANTYTEAAIDSIPEDNFSGVSIESNFVISHFELNIMSNQSEFDINELKDVLFDYQNLINDDKLELFGKINYTYYKKVEGYDEYGNDIPNIECSIDFKKNDIKLMNFENITDENIVEIGIDVFLSKNKTCFGRE